MNKDNRTPIEILREAISIKSRILSVECEEDVVTNIDLMSESGEVFVMKGEMSVESKGHIGKPRRKP